MTTTAANIVVKIPIASVTPKPFTGPVPNQTITRATNSVVTFESRIADQALSKPASRAVPSDLPSFSSSRIRSKIRMFASTDIASVSTIPAMPGIVSVAPMLAITPRVTSTLTPIPKAATNPPRV